MYIMYSKTLPEGRADVAAVVPTLEDADVRLSRRSGPTAIATIVVIIIIIIVIVIVMMIVFVVFEYARRRGLKFYNYDLFNAT